MELNKANLAVGHVIIRDKTLYNVVAITPKKNYVTLALNTRNNIAIPERYLFSEVLKAFNNQSYVKAPEELKNSCAGCVFQKDGECAQSWSNCASTKIIYKR